VCQVGYLQRLLCSNFDVVLTIMLNGINFQLRPPLNHLHVVTENTVFVVFSEIQNQLSSEKDIHF